MPASFCAGHPIGNNSNHSISAHREAKLLPYYNEPMGLGTFSILQRIWIEILNEHSFQALAALLINSLKVSDGIYTYRRSEEEAFASCIYVQNIGAGFSYKNVGHRVGEIS